MNPLDRLRLIARVFSRPVLEAIARSGDHAPVVSVLARLGVGDKALTVAELFDAALEELGRGYRCEYVYKAAIASRIVYGRHSPRTSSLAIELGVDTSIVDAAVFNGTSTAYEIKTELDSPARLTTQTPAYLRAFEKVNVVTDPGSGERYLASLDERVGVLVLNKDNSISTLRAATGDISRIEPLVVYRLLRRSEQMKIVHKFFGPQPALPNGLLDAHYRSLFGRLSPEQAHGSLVRAMKARTTDQSMVEFLNTLPNSLKALGYATPLSTPQKAKVVRAMQAYIRPTF